MYNFLPILLYYFHSLPEGGNIAIASEFFTVTPYPETHTRKCAKIVHTVFSSFLNNLCPVYLYNNNEVKLIVT